MLCEEVTDVTIVKHGNTFDRFYRFPNPEFVHKNELAVDDYKDYGDHSTCT